MAWKKPVLADRVREEISEIALECHADGRDLAERLSLELQQARRAMATVQQTLQPGTAKDYVVQLHTARIAAFELELLKCVEPHKA